MDENSAGATITAVATTNATSVTVDNDSFEVAGGNLKLKAGTSLDFEAVSGGTIDVVITASGDGASATHTVTVTVNDVNEAPGAPALVDPNATLAIDENDDEATVTSLEAPTDPDSGDTVTLSVDDSRFEITSARILKLKDGHSLDQETESSVDLVITATDSGGLTATTNITVTVNDLNEAPVVGGSVANVTTEAGKKIDVLIDLTALFTDPDAGDSAVRWELSGNPSWLGLEVQYVTDSNGNERSIGHLRGTAPTTGADSSAVHNVTLTARDADGAAAQLTFTVIVDDGNDDVTGVNLLDSAGNKLSEAEVNENDASGVVFGKITVDDIDHPLHPHGMHKVTVNDSRFEIRKDADGDLWLALKAGVSLDHEVRNGEVSVTVTAQDINGERKANGQLKGSEDSDTFTIIVNDVNDAPKAGTIGNWWVTVDEDLDTDDVTFDGQWLKFNLEVQGAGDTADKFPAFTDQDVGDALTYSLSGPSWLQINARSGEITSKKGTLPTRGVHSVTVTATDKDGEAATASFNLNVAFSGKDDNNTEDNEDPEISNASDTDYEEGSGRQVVGTFTVTDDDQDIPDHPFAIKTVEIVSVKRSSGDGKDSDLMNATLRDLDGEGPMPAGLYTAGATVANPDKGYAAAFVLSEPVKNGNTWTYTIYAQDTDPRSWVNTLDRLDHESVEDIEIVVRVTDGTAGEALIETSGPGYDTEDFNIGIDDANERPGAEIPDSLLSATGVMTLLTSDPSSRALPPNFPAAIFTERNYATAVDQEEASKVVLHINLYDVWNDPDRRDDDDDLTYTATSSASWIKILHGPGEWRDVQKGRDGETGGDDDLTWGSGGENVTVRDVGDSPGDNDVVVVVEIDRTKLTGSIAQGDRGALTLTATDDDGLRTTAVVPVLVTDENLDIGADAVTISGSPREGSTLRASFNANRDPDLAGANPSGNALVLYTWSQSASADGEGRVIQAGTSNQLTLTQAQVGQYIKVEVTYYEVFGGQFISSGDQNGQLGAANQVTVTATTPREVSNTPDDGVAYFTITAGSDRLTASAIVTDEDHGGAVTDLTYQWQVSDNGRGGWTDATGTGNDSDSYTLDDGGGKYYRVVVSYNEDPNATSDNPEQEQIASHVIQVSDIEDNDADTPNAITPSGSPNPGGTLSISGSGVDGVQWQRDILPGEGEAWVNIPGATGNLSLTSAYAGATVRALVTYESSSSTNPGVEAVVPSNPVTIGGTSQSARPVVVDKHEVTASVSGTGHAATARANAGDGVLSGQTVSVETTVPLASLFHDTDTPDSRLSFTASNGDGLPGKEPNTGRTAIFRNDEGILVLEPNGKLTYVSDQLRGHDGDDGDGAGNVLKLNITANDHPRGLPSGDSVDSQGNADTAEVSLRINVAPTDIDFDQGDTATGTLTGIVNAYASLGGDVTAVTVNERVTATGDEILAEIDVQDENAVKHAFGTHQVTVTGDDRFVITKSGGASARKDSDGDGSTWELRLVKGAKFDYETQADMLPATPGKQIVLTFAATDGGGLGTPTPNRAVGYEAITLVITVKDNPIDNPSVPGPDDTPGLKDDETNDSDDTTDGGEGGDTDVDGGDPTPPPPGASIGGIIEDFVDNMDQGAQDLLEDYLLTIDDGLDIA